MENMSTPAVYDNDSHSYEDYDWDNIYKSLHVMSAVILSVVCVLGVSGNGVVIWETGFRMKKTVSTVWYLSLAMADFLVTAFLPLQITESALELAWPFGWFMCKVDGVVFFMNMYASIYTLALIGVDRCVCVACPVWTRKHRTARKASWVSLGVWAMASALAVPEFVFRQTTPDEFDFNDDNDTLHSDVMICYTVSELREFESGAMGVTNFLVGFVVPLSVIVSCYSVVVYRLRNNRSLAGQSGRSLRIIATVVAAFFLCWIPFHVMRLVEVVRYQTDLMEYSVTLDLVIDFGLPITFTLALLNSCLNPLLYVFLGQGFKDVFRSRSILKVLERAFAEEPPQTSNTPTDAAVTQTITLSGIQGSTAPPGT